MITLSKYTSLAVYAQYDPTKTTALRNQFARDMKNRFAKLTSAIITKVRTDDCFGLEQKININDGVSRATFAFPRSQDKVEGFMAWIDKQVKEGILQVKEYEQIGSAVNTAWTNKYIEDSYKRGVIRARYELDKAGFDIPTLDETGGVTMSLTTPFHMDRLGLLYGRVFTDLKGITAVMDTQISRILAQGLADGDNPRVLAKKLVSTINGTSMGELGITDKLGRFIPAARRAEVLARTEIIRAHHQATIQEYKNWAVEGVIVQGEWLTAQDGRVCEKCKELEGKVFTLDAIDGMLPLHPQCRCIALPAKVKAKTEEISIPQVKIPDEPIRVEGLNAAKEAMSNYHVSDDHRGAILNYTSESYNAINGYYRGMRTKIADATKQVADTLDDFLTGAPKVKMETYRGIVIDTLFEQEQYLKFSNLKAKDLFIDPAFMSTLYDIKEASKFGDIVSLEQQKILFTIEGKNGVLIEKLSDSANELEVLLPRNSKFEIISITKNTKEHLIKIKMKEL